MGMRRSCPVLVGREAELHALQDAVADRRVRPVVLVGGEAGVGKTRLVAELMARVSEDATAVGACVHLGADALPYAPFVDGLGRYVESLGPRTAAEAMGPGRVDLETMIPELAATAAIAEAGTSEAPPSRGRLYEAVRRLLDRAPSPLVFVLEDIHWADQSSLELLAYLASRLREGRTSIVATFRSDELHRRHPLVAVLAELARAGRSTRIDVERLGRDSVAGIVHAVLDEASDDLVSAVAERSDGNPFLVEELLALDHGPSASLPGSLREILLARIGLLGEPARRALDLLAVLGRPADVRLLAAAWDEPADLDTALREAVERATIVVDQGTGRLAFRHALIGEAVADDVLPGERIRIHAVLARVLSECPDLATATAAGAAGEVAHHLVEARDLPAALVASIRAGDAAVAARAYPEARRHLERAVDLLQGLPAGLLPAGVDHVAVLDAAAEAAFRCGDGPRAVGLGRRALAEAEPAAPPARISHLLGRLLEWLELTGDPIELAALAERAASLVPAEPATRERAHALLSLAAVRMHAGRDRRALALAREAAEVAGASGAMGSQACARAIVAISLASLGQDEGAIAEIEHAVALADRSRGPAEIGVAHIDRPAVYSLAGRFADLPRVLAESRLALEREGLHDLSEPLLASDEVELLTFQGRWPEAEALADRVLDRMPPRLPRATHLLDRGLLRVRSGRLDEGESDLRAVLAIQPLVEPEMRAQALGTLAEAAMGRTDPGAAVDLLDEARGLLVVTDEVPGRVHLAAMALQACADLAEQARARRRPSDGVDAIAETHLGTLFAARAGTLVEGGATDGRVAARVAWGLAEDRRRRGEPDPGAWDRAADLLRACGEPHLAAVTLYRAAEAELACGNDRGRAAARLRKVAAWATTAGAAPLLADVQGLARRARLQLDAPAGEPATADPAPEMHGEPDPYGLSPRELEVLEMLLDGRTNREIGAALFITDKTASSHVTHILDKLGVTSRGAAAAIAARAGLVSSERRVASKR